MGIFLPILPTTPFILLPGFLFSKSSDKFHSWLLNNKFLGKYIKNYTDKKGFPLKEKIFTILLLWITISISAFYFVQLLWLKILLFIIAIAVTIHLIIIPVYREE